MRYTNLKSFENHLVASSSEHLSRLYLIAVPDDFERKNVLNRIVSCLKDPSLVSFPEATGPQIFEALQSQPLFGGEHVVLVENVEGDLLKQLAKGAPAFGYLLIGTRTKTAIPKNFELEGIVLDLLDEKPWDKEKRLIEMLHDRVKAAGKELTADAASWFFEHLELNSELLIREIEKLICFCGSKHLIERSDVEAICTKNRNRALWLLAEDFVWEQRYSLSDSELRDSFHAFLAQIRSQLLVGFKMNELYVSGIPYSEWSSYFPKFRPKVLEKKAQNAKRLGLDYFRKGLESLFQIDLLSKSSAVPVEALCDLLRLQLRVV